MSKLLIIGLLFSINCYSQTASVVATTGSGTENACLQFGILSVTSANPFNMNAKTTYIITLMIDSSNNYGTFSETGSIPAPTTIIETGNNSRRIGVYSMSSATAASGTWTVTWSSSFPRGVFWTIWRIDNSPWTNNGANSVVQYKTGSGTASADPSITFDAALKNGSAVLALFETNQGGSSGTPESGFTEDFDIRCNPVVTDNRKLVEHKNASDDNSPSYTHTASDWIGVVLEFAFSRRATVIN